jgi:hypothetical protein
MNIRKIPKSFGNLRKFQFSVMPLSNFMGTWNDAFPLLPIYVSYFRVKLKMEALISLLWFITKITI